MLVTVFTPLYNRENSIRDVYTSLCNQTCFDFEWLVINDGSTDSSGDIMDGIVASHNNSFPIRYSRRENRGLMATLNEGITKATGKLFMRLDSDDSALPNAIKHIKDNFNLIKDKENICALVFRAVGCDGKYVGFHPFTDKQVSDFATFRDRLHATGDRSEVMKVSVFKEFPFPIIESEKFCPEGLIWNRIASQYDALYMTEPIYKKGTPDDSITADVFNYLKRNVKGTTLYYREIVANNNFSFKYRLLNTVKFYRYAFYSGESLFDKIPLRFVLLGLPLGVLVIVYDKIR